MTHAHKNRLTRDGKMHFGPKETAPLGDMQDRINDLLDTALVAHSRAEYARTRGSGKGDVAKKRIGAGYIGVECARDLAYRYHKIQKEDRHEYVSAGELQRHAESGHWTEEKTAVWLKLAGFDLLTHHKDERGQPILDFFGKPKQFGFYAAKDPETGQARIAGEADGVIVGVPEILKDKIPVPCLWESKKATQKKFTKFSSQGVAKADPVYYGQIQTMMAYMNLERVLFSMLNLNTMKYYWELISFDRAKAQELTDRAVRVMQSQVPEELPRITNDPANFKCKFCDFQERCWEPPAVQKPAQTRAPTWLKRGA